MPIQTPTSTPGSLDQDAVNLVKAIRQTESGGNFSARGKSGELGAYQYTQPTWDTYSKKHGVNVPLEQATPEQQNEVTYKQIKEWKDSGYNPGQIASMWNSGKPDAYLDKGYKGTNKLGIAYDVPKYAESVAKAYQTIKQGGQVGADPNNPSSTAAPEQKEGFLPGVFRAVTAPVVSTLARIPQAIARVAGVSPEKINEVSAKVPFYGQKGYLDLPETGKDILKDVGRAAQTVSLGMPVASIPKAIGAGAVMGAGSGLEQEQSFESTLKGGAIGGALGLAGAGVSKLLQSLPKSLTRTAFNKMNESEVEQVLATKSMGTKSGLLRQSEKAVSQYGDDLGKALQNPKYKDVVVGAKDVLTKLSENEKVKQQLLDTGLHFDEIAAKLKSVVPEKAALIDKFFNEGLTLPDLHRLNSGLGNKVFKQVLDEPGVRAGKELGSIMYHGTSDMIKDIAKETVPLFEELSKEYGIRSVITKLARKSSHSLISWRDIVPFIAGNTLAGPFGGFSTIMGARLLESPTAQFNAAKLIQGANKGLVPVTSRAGLLAAPANQK